MEKDQSRRSLPAQIGKGGFEILLPSDRGHDQLRLEHGGPGSQVTQQRFQKPIIAGLSLLAMLFLGYIIGSVTAPVVVKTNPTESAPTKMVKNWSAPIKPSESAPSVPASVNTISSFNFLVDYHQYAGKRVTVGPCRLHAADTISVLCRVANASGRNVGSISLPSANMERASFRRALTECAGSDTPSSCEVYIAGTVEGDRRLVGAEVHWR
jgi:hypothetical protein